jgi:hypothetical protein
MKKQRFYYSISGYRWAPESFRVRKGLVGHPEKELLFTSEERTETGRRLLVKGFQDALGYVKHIERKYAHKHRTYITYGFWTKEPPVRYIYCPQLRCRSDADLSERLYIFKEVRRCLKEVGGSVELSVECELDGNYTPVHIKRNTVTADFDRPLRILLAVV